MERKLTSPRFLGLPVFVYVVLRFILCNRIMVAIKTQLSGRKCPENHIQLYMRAKNYLGWKIACLQGCLFLIPRLSQLRDLEDSAGNKNESLKLIVFH